MHRLMTRTVRHSLLAVALALVFTACIRPAAPEPAEATGFVPAGSEPAGLGSDTRADGVLRDSYGRPFSYGLLGQPLPELAAPTSDGGTFRTGQISRWTVISIWGAWCGDCRADGQHVEALMQAIRARDDLDFVSIHVPASRSRATPEETFGRYGSLQAYFRDAGYEIPSVVLDEDAGLRERLQVSWTPTYLLVSPDGIVQGFRTDLSAAGPDPVRAFLADIDRAIPDRLAVRADR